jgi:DNA-binding NtrC family response regulator
VNNFERTYITQALVKHGGNIAMAARASNKHRRAFWALMRKHDIVADQYREEDDEG